MALDKTWKKWVYRFGLVCVGLSFPLGTIIVGLQFFVIGQGQDNWKTTDTNLVGAVQYIFYIAGYLLLFALIASAIILTALS